MSEEEIKCLNNCGFANVTQLLLAYVSLQQENSQLKIQISAREEVANKYKKVIDETRHYVEKECNDLLIGYFHNRFDTTEYYEKLLQILDKGESNE